MGEYTVIMVDYGVFEIVSRFSMRRERAHVHYLLRRSIKRIIDSAISISHSALHRYALTMWRVMGISRFCAFLLLAP